MQWLALAVLCCLTVSIRCFRNSFAPSVFTGLFWIVYLIPSLWLVERLEFEGIWALVLLICCIQVGAFVGEHVTAESQPYQPSFNFSKRIFWFTTLSLAAIAYLIRLTVSENGLDYSLLGLLEVGGIWTVNRYARIYEPWPYRMLIIWFHPACLFAGIAFASAIPKKKKLLALFALFPPLLCTVFTGARAAFLIGLACFLSGYWAVLNLRGATKLINFRRVLAVFVIACFLISMFFGVDYIRGSRSESNHLDIDTGHIYDYMFGSPAAFSKWFVNGDRSITGGAMTFPSVFEAVGARSRSLGLYDKEVVVISGYFTNVYTLFRGLAQDFTLGGAIIICLLFGFWSGTVYRKRSLWLSIFYATMLYSPIVCLFIYNGTILAWACLGYCIYRARTRPAFRLRLEQATNS